MKAPSTAIIGSGNVATQLAVAFAQCGHPPLFILSRNKVKGKQLARKAGTKWVSALPETDVKCLLFLCVSDDAIRSGAVTYGAAGYTPVHTSGMVNIKDILLPGGNAGVFYPLQTFSLDSPVDWKSTPIFLEASDRSTYLALRKIAGMISSKVLSADSTERASLHLAAVFANNFANACLAMAESLLQKDHLAFSHLHPLIKQSMQNVLARSPQSIQTGPARRGDFKTQKKHLELLRDQPELQKIYKLISSYISEKYS